MSEDLSRAEGRDKIDLASLATNSISEMEQHDKRRRLRQRTVGIFVGSLILAGGVKYIFTADSVSVVDGNTPAGHVVDMDNMEPCPPKVTGYLPEEGGNWCPRG